MNSSHKNAIKKFSKNTKKILKDNLVDILVYGSVARGESNQDSDVDIIVVVKRNAFRTQMRLAALSFDILMETGEYLSVQTMKSKDLKRDTIFLHNVRRDSIHAL